MVLALMMALSCMAMPAMAAEDEEIMPLKPSGYCSKCGEFGSYHESNNTLREVSIFTCDNKIIPHKHLMGTVTYKFDDCGHTEFVEYDICKG